MALRVERVTGEDISACWPLDQIRAAEIDSHHADGCRDGVSDGHAEDVGVLDPSADLHPHSVYPERRTA